MIQRRLHGDCLILITVKVSSPLLAADWCPPPLLPGNYNIHLIDTVCISSYGTGRRKRVDARILKDFKHDGEGWLLIDDLVDTGRTARIVKEMIPKAHFATVYAKPSGRAMVDTFITEVSQDTWILFPWDSEVQFVQPLAGSR